MTDTTPQTSSSPASRRWLWIVLAISALLAAWTLVWEAEDTANVTERKAKTPAPLVSILEVSRASTTAQVATFAELRPRWDAEIRAAVSGQIIEVHEAALAGTRVDAGTPLFSIQSTPFETAVASAEVALEQSKLTLLQAQNQVTVARRQFERDGVDAPNDLALNIPQLRIAERDLKASEAQLRAARRQLEDTVVTAPFSGFVTERVASLGQTVAAGEALLHLSDDHQFELVAELNPSEWALLDHPIAGGEAQLFHRNGQPLGTARIRQGGGFLDPDTRQVRVFLDVSNENAAILSGDYLKVVLTGQSLDDTLTLPDAALTRAGHVWFVGAGNELLRHTPDILFRSDDRIVISPPETNGPWKVATSPLASFLPGQSVTPKSGN